MWHTGILVFRAADGEAEICVEVLQRALGGEDDIVVRVLLKCQTEGVLHEFSGQAGAT